MPPVLKWVQLCWNKFKWASLVRTDLRDLSNFQVNQLQQQGDYKQRHAALTTTGRVLIKATMTFKNCDYIFVRHPLSDFEEL